MSKTHSIYTSCRHFDGFAYVSPRQHRVCILQREFGLPGARSDRQTKTAQLHIDGKEPNNQVYIIWNACMSRIIPCSPFVLHIREGCAMLFGV